MPGLVKHSTASGFSFLSIFLLLLVILLPSCEFSEDFSTWAYFSVVPMLFIEFDKCIAEFSEFTIGCEGELHTLPSVGDFHCLMANNAFEGDLYMES